MSETVSHVHDAKRATDPTRTLKIRRAFADDLSKRWLALRQQVAQVIVDQNAFGLVGGSSSQAQAAIAASGDGQVQAFEHWVTSSMSRIVIQGDGTWVGSYVRAGYQAGLTHAEGFIGATTRGDRKSETLVAAAASELKGIAAIVTQQMVREFATGVLLRLRPFTVARAVQERVKVIGEQRSKSLANTSVVRAHAHATLDSFIEAGITQVGLTAEAHLRSRITDAKRKPAPTARQIARSRIGKRVSQARLATAEKKLQALKRVDIVTAGDNDVCPICEELEERGPYAIDVARDLIPAHPNCRCVFSIAPRKGA